ncbi:hypothetical protein BD779DRAFT_412827 [Infundibulicybe gibba]|nr:hypothetical protein BD779DRAFT_412827 [Infundibulicybe gibba]
MAFFSRPQSAAVKIVNPSGQDETTRSPRKDSAQRQCRNILIHGSCKFQDKGCVYYHPPAPAATAVAGSDALATSVLTPQAVNAPVFVPKAGNPTSPPPLSASRQSALTSPSPPSPSPQSGYQAYELREYENYHSEGQIDDLSNRVEALDTHYYDDNPYAHYPAEYDLNGMDGGYFSPHNVFIRQPLNYHLYTPEIPANFLTSDVESHFVPPSMELRQSLQKRSETIHGAPPPDLNLPEELQGYHTLVPIDNTGPERRKFGNWYSTVYRATNNSNGLPYCLRRIENYRLTHQAAFAPIEAWSNIRHPGIVNISEAFTTRAFGDNSLVVAYAYHANAQTLFDLHFKSRPQPTQPHYGRSHAAKTSYTITERTLWSYIIQLASAIKKVHDSRQAVRTIDISKVLVTGRNRVRIGSCGVIDVLLHDAHQDVGLLQQEDLNMFGRLIFTLACGNATSNGTNFQKSLETIGRVYSQDIKNITIYLLSKGGPPRHIDQVLDMLRGRTVTEMDDALRATDRLEHELLGELENARLVRLLCKFGFINERPEFAREPQWSETGDRYIIKLFRDYVFHQVDENNNPVVNLSHVLTCLNKLDVGTDEKIMLVTRDEQNCLVVSYKEIKACVESAFGDLARGTTSKPQSYR